MSRSSSSSRKRGGPSWTEWLKRELRQWAEALVVALVIVLIIRTLLFDLFRIPTPSMEENLLVGDYLFVSQVHYGPRLPLTLGVPFTSIYLPGIEFPYTRLPGFTSVDRGDAIVFNYPADEEPVDRKMHYVKRVVGMPGDSLSIRDKTVHIDGEPLPLGSGMQQSWNVHKSDERYQLSGARLRELGITEVRSTDDPTVSRVVARHDAVEEVATLPGVERIEPYVVPEQSGYGSIMYPPNQGYSPDNYGPIYIPKKGETVPLNEETWPVFGPVIEEYEDREARQVGENTFEVDGEPAETYTFEQDYYFTIGDNRDNSEDSRFWGFVPMDHVVGKAIFTYFSWDGDQSLPRFDRIFRGIQDGEVFNVEYDHDDVEEVTAETPVQQAP